MLYILPGKIYIYFLLQMAIGADEGPWGGLIRQPQQAARRSHQNRLDDQNRPDDQNRRPPP